MKLSEEFKQLSEQYEKDANKITNHDNYKCYYLDHFRAYERASEKVEQLEKENEQLKKMHDHEFVEKIFMENEQLKKQVEKMKRCENCKHEEYEYIGKKKGSRQYCEIDKYGICQGNNYKHWELAE